MQLNASDSFETAQPSTSYNPLEKMIQVKLKSYKLNLTVGYFIYLHCFKIAERMQWIKHFWEGSFKLDKICAHVSLRLGLTGGVEVLVSQDRVDSGVGKLLPQQ